MNPNLVYYNFDRDPVGPQAEVQGGGSSSAGATQGGDGSAVVAEEADGGGGDATAIVLVEPTTGELSVVMVEAVKAAPQITPWVDDPSKRPPGMPRLIPPPTVAKFQTRGVVRPSMADEPVVLTRSAAAPELQGPPAKRSEPSAFRSESGRPTTKPKMEGAKASSPAAPKPVPSRTPLTGVPLRAPAPSPSVAGPTAAAPSSTPVPSQAPAPSQTPVIAPTQVPPAMQGVSSAAPSDAQQESQVPQPRWGAPATRPTYTPTDSSWQFSRWCGYCPWRTEADRCAYIDSLSEEEQWSNCWSCRMPDHSKADCPFWVRE